MQETSTHPPSPVRAFANHSDKDAVFAGVRVQSRFKHWPGLKRLKTFSFTALCYPKSRKKFENKTEIGYFYPTQLLPTKTRKTKQKINK